MLVERWGFSWNEQLKITGYLLKGSLLKQFYRELLDKPQEYGEKKKRLTVSELLRILAILLHPLNRIICVGVGLQNSAFKL